MTTRPRPRRRRPRCRRGAKTGGMINPAVRMFNDERGEEAGASVPCGEGVKGESRRRDSSGGLPILSGVIIFLSNRP